MWYYFVVALISALLSALFSGLEALFIAISVYDISKINIPEKKFRQLEFLIFNKRIFIMIFLFLNTFVNVLFAISVYFIFLNLSLSEIVSGLISVVLITPFLFLFSEVLPKVFFRKNKEKILLLTYPLFLPIAFFNKLLPSKKNYEESSFFHILKVIQEEFDYEEYSYLQNILENVLRSENLKLKSIMKPLNKLDIVFFGSKVRDVIKKSLSSKYVFVSDGNSVVGYVDVYDLFKSNSSELSEFIKKPEVVVFEDTELSRIFAVDFDLSKPIFVVNDVGLVVGVLTYSEIYDVLSSIVVQNNKPKGQRSFVVSGDEKLLNVLLSREISLYSKLEKEYPWFEEFSTVNGVIMYINKFLPKVGDEIRFGDIVFKVLEVSDFKVEKVRVEL